MQTKTIGIKELQQNLAKITKEASRGASFAVFKHTTFLCRIEPPATTPDKKYTLADFKKIQFRSGDKNLSKNIDKILYGV